MNARAREEILVNLSTSSDYHAFLFEAAREKMKKPQGWEMKMKSWDVIAC
jgi:hypothetical protein